MKSKLMICLALVTVSLAGCSPKNERVKEYETIKADLVRQCQQLESKVTDPNIVALTKDLNNSVDAMSKLVSDYETARTTAPGEQLDTIANQYAKYAVAAATTSVKLSAAVKPILDDIQATIYRMEGAAPQRMKAEQAELNKILNAFYSSPGLSAINNSLAASLKALEPLKEPLIAALSKHAQVSEELLLLEVSKAAKASIEHGAKK